MWRVPSVSRRTGRALIILLLSVKLVLLVWNAAVFDGKTYDADYHADRALFGGLLPGPLNHDGPVYYLAALLLPLPDDAARTLRAARGEESEVGTAGEARLPRASRAERELRAERLDWLRYSNVLWLGVFYIAWVGVIFPRVLPGFESWFLASLMLVTLPGYQRLGAMSHPDNAFVGTAALALTGWVLIRERFRKGEPLRFGMLAAWAVAIGVMGATRSFAIAPVVVLTVVLVAYARRMTAKSSTTRVAGAVALLALVMGLSLSWHSLSRASVGTSFFPELAADRSGFDYGRYYTSFGLKQLVNDGPEDDAGANLKRVANSFSTLLYSDTWGDHWSNFAGSRVRHGKALPRRVLLGAAAAVPVLLLALAASALWQLITALRARGETGSLSGAPRLRALVVQHEPTLVLVALVLLGGLTFVVWQATAGLLPDDNSTVKFSYVATLFPPALALSCRGPFSPRTTAAIGAYFFLLYVLAFPIAMYWPTA